MYLVVKHNANKTCVFPEIPLHDLLLWIFNKSMTIASRWLRSPDNRKTFIIVIQKSCVIQYCIDYAAAGLLAKSVKLRGEIVKTAFSERKSGWKSDRRTQSSKKKRN